jgi:thioredoxin-related protein
MIARPFLVVLAVGTGVWGLLTLLQPGRVETAAVTSDAIVWHDFERGLEEARNTNKKVLLDVYTDWCSWCKKMDADVYASASIVRILEAHFIAIKLNAESSRELTYDGRRYSQAAFARALGVSGYPTTVFLDSQSKPITIVPGYVEPSRFGQILRYIGQDAFLTLSFEEFLSRESRSR